MADTSVPLVSRAWARVDGAVAVVVVVLLCVALWSPSEVWPTIRFTLGALAHTAPFIAFAVLAVAYLKATGAETLLSKAFEGPQLRMIVVAAAMGGLSPFCSCEVIPFISAMLALGAPISAVMAFWLASPLMDPAMFVITAAELGAEFAVAKAIIAVALGVFGGVITLTFSGSPVFRDPLKQAPVTSCCGGGPKTGGRPVWAFWGEADRRETFSATAWSNALFLTKWLALAYLIEGLMVRHMPTDWIASTLGGDGPAPILLASALGAPFYLNGYAAVALIGSLIEAGMSQGAAMSFLIAGSVSCIPAAIAVWALVKPRVFAAYAGLGVMGAMLAGFGWAAWV